MKKDGTDRLYNERVPITMDEDVVDEYLDFTGLSALPKNKFVMEKLNNVPAKSIADEAFNSAYEPNAIQLMNVPLNDLSLEELKTLAVHYDLKINDVHKKARKAYVHAYKEILEEIEKREKTLSPEN